ncbi:hypothetical protein [Carnobacterium divergens]|uniref:hypothetical protein n=1 Tax=Carnobacterium divergens TaxID=2748 RepID=UPI001EE7BF61|nr:hypothetical protein [Carnobacterium divergens]
MKRDIRINYGTLDELIGKLNSYLTALTDIEKTIKQNQQMLASQDGEAFIALEASRKKIESQLAGQKKEIQTLHSIFSNYATDMETYIHPNNRGTQVRVSRNDIWFNLKQIQSATSTIQQTYPGIPFEFHNPLETDKDKVKRQKANGATARSMQKDMIQYFTKNLLPLYEEMEALYKNNVISFENTDDEYVKTAKEKMETYLDPAKLLATAQKQNRGAVVNFVKGMWSSVKGVAGLAKTAVEYSVAGTAFVYGKVTGKMPKWAEKRMGNAKEFAKKVWQDPFSILEGMGQGLSDTYENEGVSYLAGAFVGDYLIAKGATKAVKAMKKPKSGKVGSEVGSGKKASGANELLKSDLLDELSKSGVKYSPDDVVMITKNTSKDLLWLEYGNNKAGLTHIEIRHAADFSKRGIKNIPEFIYDMLKKEPISIVESSRGMNAIYLMNGKKYLIAYGKNGFIVSVYPI